MSSEYRDSTPDHKSQQPFSSQSSPSDDDTQPRKALRPPIKEEKQQYEEPIYREHVSGPLQYQPPVAPSFYPADLPEQQNRNATQEQAQSRPYSSPQKPLYPAQQGLHTYPSYPAPNNGQQYGWSQQVPNQQHPYGQAYYGNPAGGYPGYYGNNGYHGYYPYAPYAYPWQPPRPKRDTYLLTMAIISTICSGIVLITGVICGFILFFTILTSGISSSAAVQQGQIFSSEAMFTALTIAGLGGGSFSLYHSIRALLKKRSFEFRMPWFWIFLGLYIILLAIGFAVRGNEQTVKNIPLSISYIGLAGLLPALTILALAVRRLHYPKGTHWPTTWRRFTVALVSGATSAILFAIILELILGLIVQVGLSINSFNLDDPNMTIPHDIRAILYMFIIAAIIAPLVEEAVKPLAVVALVGRISSAAEAFLLGLACGIGFDLIETTGYISRGYTDWVDIALQRSTAGLLHGFGAGMVALGWYFLTHGNALKRHRILLGIGCGIYAVLQHAIWNGSFAFGLIPGPIGNFFDNGHIMIGNYPLDGGLLIYIFWSILMLLFFLFVTARLAGRPMFWRGRRTVPPADGAKQLQAQPGSSQQPGNMGENRAPQTPQSQPYQPVYVGQHQGYPQSPPKQYSNNDRSQA